MKVSVIVPVYNAERFVRATLDSVLAQTWTEWECVCVDDGSTDSSGAILEEYAARDSRVRVVRRQNGGVSAARNAGMDAATGSVVTFLDADDTYVAHALEFLVTVWEETGADVIRYDCHFVQSHSEDLVRQELPAYDAVDVNELAESPLRRCRLGCATALSAAFARQVRWPALTHCEDPLFVLRCLRLSRKSVFVRGELVNYLVRSDSASHAVSLPVVKATCQYLPLAYDECAKFSGFSRSRQDTCAFLSGFLTGPLARCGRDVARSDRKAAEDAVRTVRSQLASRDPAFACCTAPPSVGILRKLQYRLFRHLEKDLRRKGVALDESL